MQELCLGKKEANIFTIFRVQVGFRSQVILGLSGETEAMGEDLEIWHEALACVIVGAENVVW